MTDIKSLLPHRDPFLFVDRIEKSDAEEVVAYRRFTGGSGIFFLAAEAEWLRLIGVAPTA
jgi:3-hydroxymyristoyl/3-hydroxydecanoyl-(acyl carrier protein) dehydratase